jgi:hypothetical protein
MNVIGFTIRMSRSLIMSAWDDIAGAVAVPHKAKATSPVSDQEFNMDGNPTSADFCACCKRPLEIVTVRFRFGGVDVVSACPECPVTGTQTAAMRQEADGITRIAVALRPPVPDSLPTIHENAAASRQQPS